MRNKLLLAAVLLLSLVLVSYVGINYAKQPGENLSQSAINSKHEKDENLKLGAFSVSLSVKDLKTSREFYENLGFKIFGGGMDKNYLIMKNGNTLIGIFQGMFEGNMLTFNPGWDENATNTDPFDDVRKIQNQLKNKGISIAPEADEKTSGPAFIMLSDPDGNKILIDQHR
jgi:catechol 2,3-dioxygenase-like lactoylglutathione lyase family enzyme